MNHKNQGIDPQLMLTIIAASHKPDELLGILSNKGIHLGSDNLLVEEIDPISDPKLKPWSHTDVRVKDAKRPSLFDKSKFIEPEILQVPEQIQYMSAPTGGGYQQGVDPAILSLIASDGGM